MAVKPVEKKPATNCIVRDEKKLQVERHPTGLYSVSFTGGGNLPEELKGKFTSIDKLRKLVMNRYEKDMLV